MKVLLPWTNFYKIYSEINPLPSLFKKETEKRGEKKKLK